MRKFKVNATVLVVFILMYSIIGLSSAQQQASDLLSTSGSISYTTTTPGWLHVSGENIYDSNGNIVKLRFTQLFAGNQISSQEVYESDIMKIKNWGFNGIRLVIYWASVQPNSPTSINTAWFTDPNSNHMYYTSIDNIVNWAAAHGLYIILEPFFAMWTGEDVPVWARSSQGITEGDSNIPNPPANAISDIFHNTTIADGVFYMYNWMAQHYASYSNVIFESFNEWITTRGLSVDGGQPFQDFNNGWVSAVEQGEGGNSHLKIILYLWDLNWNYNFGYTTPSPYISGSHNNIIMATHDYNSNPSMISSRASDAHNVNRPIMDTEGDDSRIGTSGFSSLLAAYDQYNYVGWSWYHYSPDPNTESSRNLNYPSTASRVLPIMSPYF